MRPVPEGLEPHLKALLKEMRQAILQGQNPLQPQPDFSTTFAKLPAASDWKNCRVNLTDKNTLAISTEVAGVWEWLRADGSAI